MKRNRKKSSTQDKARPSTSAKLHEEHDLAYYVHDRVGLIREVFSILKPKELKSIIPDCVRNLSIDNLEELCLEELLGISSKRLCAILDGAEPPSDTDSSSSSESSISSDSEKSRQSPPVVVDDVICLDSASNDGSAKSKKKKKKKKKKKRKRKSTSSDTTVEALATEQSQIQKILQTQSNNKISAKNQRNKTSTNSAILNKSGAKPVDLFSDRVAKSNETSRAAERVGMTVLEILEVQARARAIRAQLNKEKNDVSQAGPSSSTNNTTVTKKEEDSDSEVEIKEAASEVVDLLSSSEDEDEVKHRVQELKLEVVKEPEPPPNATKTNDKTKVKRSKTANDTSIAKATKTVIPIETNNTVTPANKRRKKDKPNIENRVEIVNNKANDSILPNPKEKLPNSRNNLSVTETVAFNTVTEAIKQEEEEKESSPDLVILEDSESEKTSDEVIETLPENSKTTKANDKTVQSVLKVIDAPRTTKITKSKHKNITITVTQNDQRKIIKDRDNVVISFSNDANAIDPERDGTVVRQNTFITSNQQKHKRARSSDIIEQSAKKLNSTVTKIIKEKSKRKYLKSVILKASDKERHTRSHMKDRDKKSDGRKPKEMADNYTPREKDKESDSDEITLQLSDSEKMDLLEDLSPKKLDKVPKHSKHDTKSSDSDKSDSSSDETEQSDELTDNLDQVIIENDVANDTNDKLDVSQETADKNHCSTSEIAGSMNKDDNINNTQADNPNITKQNDAVEDSVVNNASTSNLITSEIIPKMIINSEENELRQPVKNILRNLRMDDMVLHFDTSKMSSKISEHNDEITNVNKTAENNATEINSNQLSNITPSEFNSTNNDSRENVDDKSENEDSSLNTNKNNLNVIEIRSIKDIPILSDNESGCEPALITKPNTISTEFSVDKDNSQETYSKTRKKKRIKLKRKNKISSSIDDSVESSVTTVKGTSEMKDKKCLKEIVYNDAISETNSENAICTEQQHDLQSIETAENLESPIESLQDEAKSNTKEQTIHEINDLQSQKLTCKQVNETVGLTNENQSHTDDIRNEMNESCNIPKTTSIPLETCDADGKGINDDSKAIEGSVKTFDSHDNTSDYVDKTSDSGSKTIKDEGKTIEDEFKSIEDEGKTIEDEGKTNKASDEEKTIRDRGKTNEDKSKTINEGAVRIENLAEIKVATKNASDNTSAALQDGSMDVGIVTDTAMKEIQSKDVVEQADLEEGEIVDDKRQPLEEGEITTDSEIVDDKRQPSEEGEITTDTESEIEAQDILPARICISDEECTTNNVNRITTEKNDPNKSENKKLCTKCKRKKSLRNRNYRNVHRNSVSESQSSDNVTVIDESPKDINKTNVATVNSNKFQVNKISKDTTKEVFDNINLENITSESDSNINDSSNTKLQSKNIKEVNIKINKNITHIDLSNTYQTDSDTVETLEISDDSSDCCEILSKEPTTEEIEALSERIDRIDRLEVVTEEEIIQHEHSNESNGKSKSEMEDSNREDNERVSKSPNSNETSTDLTAADNLTWRERYMKSKKVTKVLKTSHILNALRKKNLDLKRKMLESKIAKPVTEIKELPKTVPEMLEIGSIEHYKTLESSTKYVDPVQEVTKEMKKDAKQLLKMYKNLIKHNNMFKEKDRNKKKKKKERKNKDGDASCSSVVAGNTKD